MRLSLADQGQEFVASLLAPAEAAEHFGWIARFFGIDGPASSARTRELLGWRPKQPGLIDDLGQPYYFATSVVSMA